MLLTVTEATFDEEIDLFNNFVPNQFVVDDKQNDYLMDETDPQITIERFPGGLGFRGGYGGGYGGTGGYGGFAGSFGPSGFQGFGIRRRFSNDFHDSPYTVADLMEMVRDAIRRGRRGGRTGLRTFAKGTAAALGLSQDDGEGFGPGFFDPYGDYERRAEYYNYA